MTAAGFAGMKECLPSRETSIVPPEVLKLEWERDLEVPHTLIVEARKPVSSHRDGRPTVPLTSSRETAGMKESHPAGL